MATMEQLVEYALKVSGDDSLVLEPVPAEYAVSSGHREALKQAVRERIDRNVATRTASSLYTRGFASK